MTQKGGELTKSDYGKTGIHKIWHEFGRRFIDGLKGDQTNRGETLDKVYEWAKKHPNDVYFAQCDDSSFMSSDIILVDHKTKDNYMGITAVVVPQCQDPVVTVFFYPGHIAMLKTIIDRKILEARKLSRIAEKKERLRWKEVLKESEPK